MSRYLLLPQFPSATYLHLAAASIIADLPSGKLPTALVRLLTSRLSRSMPLLVRIRRQCSIGNLA